MPSSPTTSNRYQKTAAGEHNNTWAADLDTNLDLIDVSLDGWLEVALVGNTTLTSVNYATDQSRYRALHFTGAGAFTVTAPNVSKNYIVWNACTGILTLSNGTSTVTLQSGEVVGVVTDGASNFKRVQPTDFGSQRITSVSDPLNPQDVATRAYVLAQAFAALAGNLPGQGGSAGRFLTTNGSVASWGYSGLNGRRAITGVDTVIATDQEKLLACSGTFVLSLTAPATLGNTFGCYLQNSGGGNVTLTPASGLIDGLASYIMYPGEVRLLICDGSNFYTVVLNPFSKVWTTTDAGFIWPPGYQAVEGLGWGGGGGGGGGGSTTAAGGGGGGACTPYVLPASGFTAGATATVTIGAGGTAGGLTLNGGDGGSSSIAALVTFYGGGGGLSGANSGAGGGVIGAAATNTAGLPTGGQFGGGASSGSGSPGNPSVYGGASGGGGNNAGAGGVGGVALYGGGGGAGGSTNSGTPLGGVSTFGGRGGNAGATVGGAGVAPGGGGAGGAEIAGTNYTGGAGARGEVRMRGVI